MRNEMDWIKFYINLTNIIDEKNEKMKEYYYCNTQFQRIQKEKSFCLSE